MTDAPINLDALEALIAAATPGPYEAASQGGVFSKGAHAIIASAHQGRAVSESQRDANAALIVAAVNALPGIIARLRAAEAERDALRDLCAAVGRDRRITNMERAERRLAVQKAKGAAR